MSKEENEYSVALLTKAMEQLKSKGDKLNKIDEQIATLINDPHALEEYVLESEELQEDITDKITRIQTFIELQGPKSQESGSHLADQPPVSQHEVDTNPPQLVTTTTSTVTTCLLKTAVAPIIAGNNKTKANILFDEGAQRSFISIDMVKELGISPTSTTDISLASFGSASRLHQKLGVTTVEIKTVTGELIPISTLIVPTIAAPIQNAVPVSVNTMPRLRGLKLAHPVTSNNTFTNHS